MRLAMTVVTIVAFTATASFAQESASYQLKSQRATGGGVKSASATTYSESVGTVGQGFVGTPSGGAVKALTGFIFTIVGAGSISQQFKITTLVARTTQNGTLITQKTWQNDNDPFFEWEHPGTGFDIAGYSFAIDAAPDDTIDTADTKYQYPDNSLFDGTRVFGIKAQNTAGTFGDVTYYEIWVDTIAPSVGAMSPVSGTKTKDAKIPVSATFVETGSGIDSSTVTLKINGNKVQAAYDEETKTVSYTPSYNYNEGANVVSAEATDMVGNVGTPTSWQFIVDTQPPTGSILINGGDKTTTTQFVTLTLDAQDATTTVTQASISNDGVFDTEGWETYIKTRENWPLTYVSGTRTVYVKFKDELGNESDIYSDTIDFIISAPDTYITAGPSGIVEETTATFAFAGSLEGCMFKYKFDNEDWSDWASDTAATKPNLSEGNHYFAVQAGKDIDNSGVIENDEEDASPAQRSWTISAEGIKKPARKPYRFWRSE